MKTVLKYLMVIVGVFSFVVVPFNDVFGVRLVMPNSTRQEDVNIGNLQIDSQTSNEGTIYEYIRIINSYLWFAIGLIAMILLIYAGIIMITSGGDKGKVGKAGKMALYGFVGIIIAMLSYAIVNLIINLL